jgi:hypothetical protein
MDGSPRYGHDHPPIYPESGPIRNRVVITLSAAQVAKAEHEGKLRSQRHVTKGRRDRFRPQDREQNDIQAVGAELAVCEAFGLPWTGGADPDRSDAGPLGVRRSTLDCMPIRQHDRDDQPQVFVQGTLPTFTILGWQTARIARRRDDWLVQREPFYWCVPQSALRLNRELLALIVSDDLP